MTEQHRLGTAEVESALRTRALRAEWTQVALPPLAFFALFIAWQWTTSALQIRAWILPAPTAIVATAYHWRFELLRHTSVTAPETIIGFALAAVAAIPLSIAAMWSLLLRRTLYPILLALQSIPKMALAPLITLWVGFGLWPKIVVVFLVCFFPIIANTVAARSRAGADDRSHAPDVRRPLADVSPHSRAGRDSLLSGRLQDRRDPSR